MPDSEVSDVSEVVSVLFLTPAREETLLNDFTLITYITLSRVRDREDGSSRSREETGDRHDRNRRQLKRSHAPSAR